MHVLRVMITLLMIKHECSQCDENTVDDDDDDEALHVLSDPV